MASNDSEAVYYQDALTDAAGEQIKHDFVHFNWQWLNERKKRYNWGQLTSNLLLIGQAGNITPCHFDEQHNFFNQLQVHFVVHLPGQGTGCPHLPGVQGAHNLPCKGTGCPHPPGYSVPTPPPPPWGTWCPHLPAAGVQGAHTSQGYRVSTPPSCRGTGCPHLPVVLLGSNFN